MLDTTYEPIVEFKPRSVRNEIVRGEASRNRVMAAARQELVEQGWKNFSLEEVLLRCQATEQDIEQWWSTPAALVVEAAFEVVEDPAPMIAGPLDVKLARFVDPLIEVARTSEGAYLLRCALLAASDDAQAGAEFRNYFNIHFRKPLKAVLAEASTRGEIRRDYDIDICCELLFGPIWHRLVIMRSPLPEVTARRAAHGLIASLRG